MCKAVKTGSGKTQEHICGAASGKSEAHVDMRALKSRKIWEKTAFGLYPDAGAWTTLKMLILCIQ